MNNSLTPQAQIENLLFVASNPVPACRLTTVLNLTTKTVDKLLDQMQENYLDRGSSLQWTAEGVQLTTAPFSTAHTHPFLQHFGLESIYKLPPLSTEDKETAPL